MVLYFLYSPWNFDFQISVFGTKLDDFALKNGNFVAEVYFLMIKLFYSGTMIDRFLQVCYLYLQVLIVGIGY